MNKYENTEAAAEEKQRRQYATIQLPKTNAAMLLAMVSASDHVGLRILSRQHGSLTGLVLAAEGISQ